MENIKDSTLYIILFISIIVGIFSIYDINSELKKRDLLLQENIKLHNTFLEVNKNLPKIKNQNLEYFFIEIDKI